MRKEEILKWADNKGLLKDENSEKQLLKAVEKLGELAGSILKDDKEGIRDAIGDLYVVFTIYAEQIGSRFANPDMIDIDLKEAIFGICFFINFLGSDNINKDSIKDLLGGIKVRLNYLAEHHNLTLEECVDQALNEIKI